MKILQAGVYLQTKEELTTDQKSWADKDSAKDFDFSTCPLWITTDDGQEPIGVNSEEEALEVLK